MAKIPAVPPLAQFFSQHLVGAHNVFNHRNSRHQLLTSMLSNLKSSANKLNLDALAVRTEKILAAIEPKFSLAIEQRKVAGTAQI